MKIDELQTAIKEESKLLAETTELLENQQAQNEELKTASQQFEIELSQEKSQYAELETKLQQLTEANAEKRAAESEQLKQQELKIDELQTAIKEESKLLAETTELLENQQAQNVELKTASQQFELELSQEKSQYAELETKLLQLTQAKAENRSAESEQLKQQELKIDELQAALEKERGLRTEIQEKQEASQSRLEELEDAQTSTVDQTQYDELAQKVAQYRVAYRKSKSIIEQLTAQKSEMSDLATEYLSATKTLRGQLDEQLQITGELKSKLENDTGSASSEAEINSLVEQRARNYVLKLKSQFEQRIKEKNELIRKLQKHQAVES